MRPHIHFLILPSFAFLSGCAFRTATPAPNEANTPVFHASNHLELGAQGRAMSGGQIEDKPLHGDLAPYLWASVNVNRWSSFNLLPVNWNILLTGEQHQDSSSLKVGKLHAIVTGGVTGIAYSTSAGLDLPAGIHLVGKYLLSPKAFATASLGVSTDDLVETRGSTLDGTLSFGYQAWKPTSLSLDLGLDREQIKSGWWKDRDDVVYRDGDMSLYTGLSLKAYPTPHHVLGLSGGYRTKNPASKAVGQPVASASYRYVF